jgi:hypothetical protein
MNILWGYDHFGETDVNTVVEKIMNTLNSRVRLGVCICLSKHNSQADIL